MKKRYIIGDLHFGHSAMVDRFGRPFSSVDEMNLIIIQNWNNIVTPIDRVYLLGDVSMNRKYLNLCSQLNGKKVLIKGNHDIFRLKDYLPYFEDIRSYIIEDWIVVSHMPILLGDGGKFIGNIHAHVHSNDINDYRYINVSAERVNYTPVLLEDMKQILFDRFPKKL